MNNRSSRSEWTNGAARFIFAHQYGLSIFIMGFRKKILLLVPCLIVALGIIAVVALRPAQYRARKAATAVILTNVANASRAYFTNYGFWPRSLTDLTTTNNPWHLIFIEFPGDQLTDAWGHPITYLPFDSSKGRGSVTAAAHDPNGTSIVFVVDFP